MIREVGIELEEMRKKLNNLRNCTAVANADGNWDADPYMMGMANGLILALAILDGVEPNYRMKPESWRCNDKNLEDPTVVTLGDHIRAKNAIWEYPGDTNQSQVDANIRYSIRNKLKDLTQLMGKYGG